LREIPGNLNSSHFRNTLGMLRAPAPYLAG
jgi:hypothetical protein